MCEKKEDLQKRISYLEGKLSEMEQVNASYVKRILCFRRFVICPDFISR